MAVSCVLSEDQFLCSICLDVFIDPVTTACGHSFCNVCINKHWDNNRSHGSFCPVCKEEFSSRPRLKPNVCLREMVSEFKDKPPRSKSEAGQVLCDVCPEPKLKALKSCLVCQISMCSNHLRPHNTAPRLTKHQLIAPVENVEERICPKHERLLEKFCRDHNQFICVQCSSDHKGHNTVPLKEQCEEQKNELQQKIQERQEKLQELQRSVDLNQENADREMKEGVDFFNDLMKCVQQSLNQFKQSIKKKQNKIKGKIGGFMKKLKSEISVLEQRRVQMEKIFSSDDHFHFVQTFTLEKPAPELKDWAEVSVRVPSYEGRAAVAVSELHFNNTYPKIKKLFENKLKTVKTHAVNVTLDRDTAHPNLVVSKDCRKVYYTDRTLPDTPKRFSYWPYVSSQQKFSSGKVYYEVDVRGSTVWWLGVVKESADRKADPGKNLRWDIFGEHLLNRVFPCLEKVGVFVDYEEGLICFFDVHKSALFHSFTNCNFNESILPVFSPGDYSGTRISITPALTCDCPRWLHF